MQVRLAEREVRRPAWREEDQAAEDEAANRFPEPLTREQAQALRAENPPVSPWWVVAAQAAVGLVAALVAWAVTGRVNVMGSALYGAAAVVVPAALMARGMTSRLSSMSPGVSAMSFMTWEIGEVGGFDRHARSGAEARAATELAGIAGGPGGVHKGVLGGAAVAAPA